MLPTAAPASTGNPGTTVSKIPPGSPRIIQSGNPRQPVKVITSSASQPVSLQSLSLNNI